MTLKGKTIIITGASSGIGEATVKLLVKKQANVVFGARRLAKLQTIACKLPKIRLHFSKPMLQRLTI